MDVGKVQTQSSVSAIAGAASGTMAGPAAAASDAGATVAGTGQSDFMKLLVAQLRNQDPFKPMEDREFIAQMAQLNTLEQITALNAKMNSLASVEAMGQASALIGRTVEAKPEGSSAIQGVVQEVWIEEGKVLLLVAGSVVSLDEIRAIAQSP